MGQITNKTGLVDAIKDMRKATDEVFDFLKAAHTDIPDVIDKKAFKVSGVVDEELEKAAALAELLPDGYTLPATP